MAQQLGFLSERYEASTSGSNAIGYDAVGGTSYGKYQIASKTGTMAEFLGFLKNSGYSKAYEILNAALPSDTGSTTGAFPTAWKKVVAQGLLGNAEHDFIKSTHYDVALRKIEDGSCVDLIKSSFALQNVLWSTAVQHGAGGAARIFNSVWKSGMSKVAFIKAIYESRATKFGSSSSRVRASVQARFDKESSQAVALAASE